LLARINIAASRGAAWIEAQAIETLSGYSKLFWTNLLRHQ
jgi:hypothetical protein